MDSDSTKLLLFAGVAFVAYKVFGQSNVGLSGIGDDGRTFAMAVNMPTGNPGMISMNQLPPMLAPPPKADTSGSIVPDPFPHWSTGYANQLQNDSAQYHVDPATAAARAGQLEYNPPPAPPVPYPGAAACAQYYLITGEASDHPTPYRGQAGCPGY